VSPKEMSSLAPRPSCCWWFGRLGGCTPLYCWPVCRECPLCPTAPFSFLSLQGPPNCVPLLVACPLGLFSAPAAFSSWRQGQRLLSGVAICGSACLLGQASVVMGPPWLWAATGIDRYPVPLSTTWHFLPFLILSESPCLLLVLGRGRLLCGAGDGPRGAELQASHFTPSSVTGG
jgi:hypothetical protein